MTAPKIAEEGSGEVIQTAPTPEQQMKRHRLDDGFGETQKEAPTPEPVCKPQKVEDMFVNKLYKVLALNWVFLMKYRLVRY